jgi:hypothetical protein
MQGQEFPHPKDHRTVEVSVVCAASEKLCDRLQCSLDDSPDRLMTDTGIKAMFALRAIGLAVDDLLTATRKGIREQ